jgi:hypothetical protein
MTVSIWAKKLEAPVFGKSDRCRRRARLTLFWSIRRTRCEASEAYKIGGLVNCAPILPYERYRPWQPESLDDANNSPKEQNAPWTDSWGHANKESNLRFLIGEVTSHIFYYEEAVGVFGTTFQGPITWQGVVPLSLLDPTTTKYWPGLRVYCPTGPILGQKNGLPR